MKHRRYIEENRALFDDMEPSSGHMERFEALLKLQAEEEKPQQRRKKIRFFSIISVAASIAVLIAVAIKVRTPEQQAGATLQENVIANDFESVNERYNQQMQAQISNIMCKLSHTDRENQRLLTEDLQEIIEENTGFVNEMSKNKDEQLAIYYLEKHYETNIQVLEEINQKLGKYTNC
jgi:hypothetical protein